MLDLQRKTLQKQIVEKLINHLPDLKVNYIPLSNDKRNYKVDFSKIEKFLELRNDFNVSVGFKEVLDALKSKTIDDQTFYNSNLTHLLNFSKIIQKNLNTKFMKNKFIPWAKPDVGKDEFKQIKNSFKKLVNTRSKS